MPIYGSLKGAGESYAWITKEYFQGHRLLATGIALLFKGRENTTAEKLPPLIDFARECVGVDDILWRCDCSKKIVDSYRKLEDENSLT